MSTRQASALLATGVWTMLLALFAMHGLPMQASQAMTGMSATAHTAMAVVDGTSSSANEVSAGCSSMDHCTATLRQQDRTGGPATTGAVPAATPEPLHAAPSHAVVPAARAPLRPPDLTILQISRT